LLVAALVALCFVVGDFVGADPSDLDLSGASDDVAVVLCAFCWGAASAELLAFATRYRLSPRELQVARCAAAGTSTQEISRHLGISARTVETHLRHVYAKLKVRNRARLAYLLPR
jgi:DNA-binding CsgD family transcriptional regulator